MLGVRLSFVYYSIVVKLSIAHFLSRGRAPPLIIAKRIMFYSANPRTLESLTDLWKVDEVHIKTTPFPIFQPFIFIKIPNLLKNMGRPSLSRSEQVWQALVGRRSVFPYYLIIYKYQGRKPLPRRPPSQFITDFSFHKLSYMFYFCFICYICFFCYPYRVNLQNV